MDGKRREEVFQPSNEMILIAIDINNTTTNNKKSQFIACELNIQFEVKRKSIYCIITSLLSVS